MEKEDEARVVRLGIMACESEMQCCSLFYMRQQSTTFLPYICLLLTSNQMYNIIYYVVFSICEKMIHTVFSGGSGTVITGCT